MKTVAWVVLGLVLMLVGLGFVMPALAKLRLTGVPPAPDIRLLFLGAALMVAGPVVTFCCRKRGRA